MDIMLGDFVDICILVYYSSLIYLAMTEDYNRYVRVVFEWLFKSKLYLKHKKCVLLSWEVDSLDMWFLSMEYQYH